MLEIYLLTEIIANKGIVVRFNWYTIKIKRYMV